ncbi:MAG TPA: ATP-binding protein [Tepidisphaeraceae bacterium]|jgi:signal transduction histidine kinase
MAPFIVGLLLGLICAAIAAVVGYRRVLRIQKRVRHSERLAELGTLTGGLAHEIKNPLSTVQLNLQLLQEDLSPQNPAYERLIRRLGTIQRETGRLREILDDFLRYAGKLELDRQPVDLNKLVDELADFFHPQAEFQRVQLRVKKSDEPVIANVDAKLIKQALLNLMINAVHAMSENGGELILSVSRDATEACIDVIDTGTGIAPENLENIFKAYYSTKKGGTGLGLPMTRRLIEEHRGRLTVNSEVGKGSDFTIHLPLE